MEIVFGIPPLYTANPGRRTLTSEPRRPAACLEGTARTAASSRPSEGLPVSHALSPPPGTTRSSESQPGTGEALFAQLPSGSP